MGKIGNAFKVLAEYLDGSAFGWKYELAVDVKMWTVFFLLGIRNRGGAVANTVVKGRPP